MQMRALGGSGIEASAVAFGAWAIGCCNASVEQMERYRAAGQLDADQEKYNMIDRDREKDSLPFAKEHTMAFLAYSPLAQAGCTHALLGARSPAQVAENAKGGALRLEAAALEIITKAVNEKLKDVR